MQLNFDLKDVYYPKNEFNKEFKLDKQFFINAALFTVYTRKKPLFLERVAIILTFMGRKLPFPGKKIN